MDESQKKSERVPELDSVDWAILELLQVDATIPNKDIAAKVGIAASTCLERIKRMRRNGTITATRAHVLPSLLGRGEQAFLGIQVRPHARETANDFVQKALALPETLALYNVSGNDDYLVHVAVANSTELQSLIIDKLLALPQVVHCRTQLIFGEPWVAPLRHR
ncbi:MULTISPECIES: Lrp/AsnC family transcriptional regulator [Micrococcaceae]|uniref:Lrp/AsnC family transcriptional regulator n=1 Tax=Micrococcaceae TaxID=1268 RepID=UPI00071E587F|nr:Lrp/AsnC family transcriptional regulator [Arthrobacter sp. NIO-1057]KSU65917.1 ArsR family transcriptional regulator [Arthrobacter sp. NIO-1057]SCC27565.1 transcriptional regulator, AsnC family [Arthrobacter sp. NIO-1057]